MFLIHPVIYRLPAPMQQVGAPVLVLSPHHFPGGRSQVLGQEYVGFVSLESRHASAVAGGRRGRGTGEAVIIGHDLDHEITLAPAQAFAGFKIFIVEEIQVGVVSAWIYGYASRRHYFPVQVAAPQAARGDAQTSQEYHRRQRSPKGNHGVLPSIRLVGQRG